MNIEPVTQKAVEHLRRAMSPMAAMVIDLDKVDLSKGRGVLKGNDRCLWTTDKRRITICLCDDGGLVASVGKEPDMECPV